MRQFMDDDFLLTSEQAKILYHKYASKMPVIDYHCHIDPKEISKNRQFDTITQAWLSGDHYKWRLMRADGIEEQFITGDAPDIEKFKKWAATLQRAVGNPLYHWSHLELRRYFQCFENLTAENAAAVYDFCNQKLKQPMLSVRGIIRQSNVKIICTTDDPIDTLEWHQSIAKDPSFDVKVLPAFRPDRAMQFEKEEYLDYLGKLSQISGIPVQSFASLLEAVKNRITFFHSMGCRISDHGLPFIMYHPASTEELEHIFQKRLNGGTLTETDLLKLKTAFLLSAGRQYHRLSWAMQLHYGPKRNNNTACYNSLGPDTGFDCINTENSSAQMADFLDALKKTEELPKTIIYSLNPGDNAVIDSVIGCFQDSSAIAKMQHGSAWWFNDHKAGMIEHMTSLADKGMLAGFIGMLTDSRSFLSYTRHEYFRRILCNYIGGLVAEGEYPEDMEFLGSIVKDISYYNCLHYFGF